MQNKARQKSGLCKLLMQALTTQKPKDNNELKPHGDQSMSHEGGGFQFAISHHCFACHFSWHTVSESSTRKYQILLGLFTLVWLPQDYHLKLGASGHGSQDQHLQIANFGRLYLFRCPQ
ncbi:hypothetical protein TNCT_690011 [Trichonephila clavata]|uniref:Uncharacterized protein n=1 Tax=Trichonephila clavata TaxID=2740835 RepID=A0A8X6KPM2_TRICU|nr:hypothetical protein TNCT_690011 [Trichonephila clavata]